jgi:hypothetical protein
LRDRPGATAAIGILAALLTTAACHSGSRETRDGITLLRHGGMGSGFGKSTAGPIRFRDGCIWVDDRPEEPALLLWPPGAGFRAEGGALEVTLELEAFENGDAAVVAGDERTSRAEVEDRVGALPQSCVAARYWFVTGAREVHDQ